MDAFTIILMIAAIIGAIISTYFITKNYVKSKGTQQNETVIDNIRDNNNDIDKFLDNNRSFLDRVRRYLSDATSGVFNAFRKRTK